MAFLNTVRGWFGWGGNALAEREGPQNSAPSVALVDGQAVVRADSALQISALWSGIERRANIIASLPLFVYDRQSNGQKTLARGTRLWGVLHDSPNSRMTAFEFWRAMMMNFDLRGNAYARIDRDPRTGEALALWPMPADQVEHTILQDGTSVYLYRIENDVAALSSESVLHLKNLGNGTTGLPKLEYMAASVGESANAQREASKTFANGGKPTGILMVDTLLGEKQREALRANMAELASGSTSRLYVLEANMKYQPLSFTPEQQQLLESRKFQIEEMARWIDVPPVLMHHSNVTAWGSGIEQIIDGWHKLSVRPLLVNVEQAIVKRVLTPAQRVRQHVEFSHDALLRGNAKDRFEIYGKAVIAGLKTPNECRQLENDPPMPGGDTLMVQSQLVPITSLGKTTGAQNAAA